MIRNRYLLNLATTTRGGLVATALLETGERAQTCRGVNGSKSRVCAKRRSLVDSAKFDQEVTPRATSSNQGTNASGHRILVASAFPMHNVQYLGAVAKLETSASAQGNVTCCYCEPHPGHIVASMKPPPVEDASCACVVPERCRL